MLRSRTRQPKLVLQVGGSDSGDYGRSSISAHSLHKGTPREVFIREFLGEHLPLELEIGTGEIDRLCCLFRCQLSAERQHAIPNQVTCSNCK